MNTKSSMLTSLPRLLDRLQPSESMVLGGAALVVGLTSGVGVWLFKQLIDLAHRITYDGLGGALSTISPWLIALVPVVGGLIVGLMMHFFVGEERHHGVAGIMEAVALAGGRLRYKRVPAKAVAAAISIGAGPRSARKIHRYRSARVWGRCLVNGCTCPMNGCGRW